MIRIGIVGDIGSGKSHVARLFGYPVFNADVEVSKIYKKNKKCYKRLKKALPLYIKSFPVRKKKLSEAIMENKNNLKKINKIVHPQVRSSMNDFIRKNKSKKFIILDIPLLLENKMNRKNDIVVFVNARKNEINKRLKRRNKANLKIIKKLKKLQLPVAAKRKKSDFVIQNNFKNTNVKKNVKKLLEFF